VAGPANDYRRHQLFNGSVGAVERSVDKQGRGHLVGCLSFVGPGKHDEKISGPRRWIRLLDAAIEAGNDAVTIGLKFGPAV
jgi:hypothetical protein